MEEEIKFIPSWSNNHKTKEDALTHIFEQFTLSPGCAGIDGKLSIIFGKSFITITPKKKKISYE